MKFNTYHIRTEKIKDKTVVLTKIEDALVCARTEKAVRRLYTAALIIAYDFALSD